MFLARRLAFCAISVFLRKQKQMQMMTAVMVCVLSMLSQFVAQPFIERRIDLLDNLATFSVLLYILAGIFFDRLDDSHWLKGVLVVVVLVVNVLVLGVVVFLFQKGLREKRARSLVTSRVSKQAIWAAMSYREELQSVLASKPDQSQNHVYEISEVHVDKITREPAEVVVVSTGDQKQHRYWTDCSGSRPWLYRP